MQQYQDQLAAMPAMMAVRCLGGLFRGVAPVLVVTAAAAVTACGIGLYKGTKGIIKHIENTKPGDNKASKLFRDLQAENLVYQTGKKKGQPIPISDLVQSFKVPAEVMNDFERLSKKQGLPFAALDIRTSEQIKADKGLNTKEPPYYEVTVMKKHGKIFNSIKDNLVGIKADNYQKEQEKLYRELADEGQPIILEKEPDHRADIEQGVSQIPHEQSLFSKTINELTNLIKQTLAKFNIYDPKSGQIDKKGLNNQDLLRLNEELSQVYAQAKADIDTIIPDYQKSIQNQDQEAGLNNQPNLKRTSQKIHAFKLNPDEEELFNRVGGKLIKTVHELPDYSKDGAQAQKSKSACIERVNELLTTTGSAFLFGDDKNGKVTVFYDIDKKNLAIEQIKAFDIILKEPELTNTLKNRLLAKKEVGIKISENKYKDDLRSLIYHARGLALEQALYDSGPIPGHDKDNPSHNITVPPKLA